MSEEELTHIATAPIDETEMQEQLPAGPAKRENLSAVQEAAEKRRKVSAVYARKN